MDDDVVIVRLPWVVERSFVPTLSAATLAAMHDDPTLLGVVMDGDRFERTFARRRPVTWVLIYVNRPKTGRAVVSYRAVREGFHGGSAVQAVEAVVGAVYGESLHEKSVPSVLFVLIALT